MAGVLALALLVDAPSVQGGPLIVHRANDFQMTAPDGWSVAQDVAVGESMADLLMRGAPPDPQGPVGGFIIVTSEARRIAGGGAEAAAILQEGIDNLSATAMGFLVLESPRIVTLNGQAAAKVVFWTQPSTYEVYQVLYVVTSPDWGRFWAVSGGMFIWDVPAIGPPVNASLSSFTVLSAPLGLNLGTTSTLGFWLLVGGLVATVAEGTVIFVLVVRLSRRRR